MGKNMPFADLIYREEELLKRLLFVSQRQLELANDGNVTLLIQHLGNRQKLWNEFEILEEQLAPYRGIPAEKRAWKSAEERLMTESALERCKKIMEEILVNDEMCLTTTAAKKEEVETQLHRIRRGSTVAPAYLKQSQLNK